MNYRQELEQAITQLRGTERDDLADPVQKVADGFINVLSASQAVRDLQKAYFANKKANMVIESNRLLIESKKAEKILDDLIKFWLAEMSLAQPGQQGSLF